MAVVTNTRDKFEANKRRINMYIPVALADAIDIKAEEIGCNRTEMMIHILLNYFEQQKVLQLSDLASSTNRAHE